MMRCGEASTRERARRWRCCLVMGRIADACPCSRGCVQMMMVVKELTPWSGYVPSCCWGGWGSQAETCCCTRGTSSQPGTCRSRGGGGAVNKARVASGGTGEARVVPGHYVAVCATRGVDRAARYQLVLWVPTVTRNSAVVSRKFSLISPENQWNSSSSTN